jgi:hypothetical protein
MRRIDICVYVSPANRARRETIITDRNSKTKAVWRARIAIATERTATAGQRGLRRVRYLGAFFTP